MNRDSKGKFRKSFGEEEDSLMNKMNLFDRPPSVKLIMVLFLIFWLVSNFLPTQTEMTLTFKNYVCGNKTTTLDRTPGEGNTPGIDPVTSSRRFKDA